MSRKQRESFNNKSSIIKDNSNESIKYTMKNFVQNELPNQITDKRNSLDWLPINIPLPPLRIQQKVRENWFLF